MFFKHRTQIKYEQNLCNSPKLVGLGINLPSDPSHYATGYSDNTVGNDPEN